MDPKMTDGNLEWLRFATFHSPVVFYTSDPGDDFRITFISDNIERITGHSANAILRDPSFTRKRIHPDDSGELQQAFAKLTPGSPQRVRYRFRRSDDEYVWFVDELRLVKGENGEDEHAVGCMYDVTAQVEAEQEQQRLRGLLDDAIAAMPAGFAVYDASDRLAICNEAYADFFSARPDKLTGLSVAEILGRASTITQAVDGQPIDDPRQWTLEMLDRHAAASGDSFESQLDDGRSALLRVQRTRDGGTVVVRTDVTELKRAQAALSEQEARFRGIAEAVPLPIMIFRREDGQVVFTNRSASETLGIRPGATTRDLEALFVDPDVRRAYVSRVVTDGHVDGFEAETRLADGSIVWSMVWARRMTFDGAPALLTTSIDITDRKQAEQALAAREIQYRTVVENTPSSVVQLDREGRYVYVNPIYCQRIGKAREEILGRTIYELVNRKGVDLIMPHMATALSGKSAEFQGWTHYADTGDHYLQRIFQPTFDADGNIDGILGFGHDLTDLKRTQSDLEEREARFRAIAEAVPLPIVILRKDDGRALFVNERMAQLFGIGIGASPGELEALFVSAEARDSFVTRVKTNGYVDGFEAEVFRADGTTEWQLLWVRSLTYDGAPARLVTSIDISERKATEAALRSSEAQTRLILDNVPARVSYMDRQKKYVAVNRKLCEAMGKPESEIVGRTVSEVFGRKNAEALEASADRALAGETANWKGWLTYPNAGDRYVNRVYQPLEYPGRGIEGYFTFVQDITEQKRAEEEVARQRDLLHQNEKLAALGSLLAGVAHELNNPLSVVVGRSMMLEEDVADPDIVHSVSQIRNSAERCARIVKTFLAMARQQEPVRQSVDVNQLIGAGLDLVEYNLRTTGVTMDLTLAPDLPEIAADPDQLTQVLVNLWINAGQAMEDSETRRLRIATEHEPLHDRVVIEVADTGCGIAAENISRIFDPFFTTKPQGVGTGVGLSVCHGIVMAHGGTIDVDSEERRGTTFRLTFPVATGDNVTKDEIPPGAKATRNGAILVVDDETEIADMLADILGAKGYRVVVALSGREALDLIPGDEFDIVISDLKMPDIDGPTLFRTVQREAPHLRDRFIFITGDTLGAGMSRVVAETGRPCLEKPFTPKDVIAAVSQVLAAAP